MVAGSAPTTCWVTAASLGLAAPAKAFYLGAPPPSAPLLTPFGAAFLSSRSYSLCSGLRSIVCPGSPLIHMPDATIWLLHICA